MTHNEQGEAEELWVLRYSHSKKIFENVKREWVIENFNYSLGHIYRKVMPG